MDFAAQLAALDADYEQAEAFGTNHPEGPYTGEIKSAIIEEYEGTLNLNMQIRTEKGMAFPRIRLNNHPSESSMSFAKGQLQNLGHKGRLSEVPNILHGLIGQWAQINVTHTKGEKEDVTFVNVNIKKLVAAPNGQQAAFDPFAQAQAQPVQQFPAQAAPAPTDIPFDAAGNPVPVQQQVPMQQQAAPVQAAPVQQQQAPMPFDAPVQNAPQSPSQAIAAATPPAAPTGLPFQ